MSAGNSKEQSCTLFWLDINAYFITQKWIVLTWDWLKTDGFVKKNDTKHSCLCCKVPRIWQLILLLFYSRLLFSLRLLLKTFECLICFFLSQPVNFAIATFTKCDCANLWLFVHKLKYIYVKCQNEFRIGPLVYKINLINHNTTTSFPKYKHTNIQKQLQIAHGQWPWLKKFNTTPLNTTPMKNLYIYQYKL